MVNGQENWEKPVCIEWFRKMHIIIDKSDLQDDVKSNFKRIFTTACGTSNFKLFLTCCASIHELHLKQEPHEVFEDETD